MRPASRLSQGSLFAGEFKVQRAMREDDIRTVYVVEQESTGRSLVLKLFSPDVIGSTGPKETFVEQVRVGAKIASDHVVDVRAAGIDSGTGCPWIVSEYLDGNTLSVRLKQTNGPFPEWDEALSQMAHALAAAHKNNIVHGSLSTEGVFLAKSKRAGEPFHLVLLDLGLPEVARSRNKTDLSLLAYTAPEVLGGQSANPRSDVWSLGLVAFRLRTGRDYWPGASKDSSALESDIRSGEIIAASKRSKSQGGPDISPAFDSWFNKCVVRDPAARFADAHDALEGLADTLTEASGFDASIADVPPGADGTDLRAVPPPEVIAAIAAKRATKPPPLPVIQAIKENPKPAIVAIVSLIIVAGAVGMGLGAVFKPAGGDKISNLEKAQRWSRGAREAAEKACTSGEATACHGLGLVYVNGINVQKDEQKAVQFFMTACDKGDLSGCNSLAARYSTGDGVAKDSAKAMSLLTKSCDGGEALSCADLAELYRMGTDKMPKNEAKAKEYNAKACKLGMTDLCGQ